MGRNCFFSQDLSQNLETGCPKLKFVKNMGRHVFQVRTWGAPAFETLFLARLYFSRKPTRYLGAGESTPNCGALPEYGALHVIIISPLLSERPGFPLSSPRLPPTPQRLICLPAHLSSTFGRAPASRLRTRSCA